jgi:mannose-6-phosphate isomerase-like protein (cupin superfamily)
MAGPQPFETRMLPRDFDVTAPDGSGIKVLTRTNRGSMAHGTLAPGSTSLAIRHRTVDEIWFTLIGEAQIWRKIGDVELITTLTPGTSITIPLGTSFQFRTMGDEPFEFIMCTMPPWPDADEAIHVPGIWKDEKTT